MIDISKKIETLRTAKARLIVRMKPTSIKLIKNNGVPKGNVLETARTAAYMGVKKTSELIPLCHPIPIEWAKTEFILDRNEITIECEVKKMYKTGCEMEALVGAASAGLCIYDMMKPIDKEIEILSGKLVEKSGGKSDFSNKSKRRFTSAVLVISDSVHKGVKKDRAGAAICEKLRQLGVDVVTYEVIPDELETIRERTRSLSGQTDIVITSGGTGLSKRDVTPEAIRPLLTREIPGIMEAAREYGQKRTPYSMLSRGVAGVIGETLVLTLPGSTRGAEESMDALFPYVLHVFGIMKGETHGKLLRHAELVSASHGRERIDPETSSG